MISSKFHIIPIGTHVTWHYRSAIGHGTVIGIFKIGTNAGNTAYYIRVKNQFSSTTAGL